MRQVVVERRMIVDISLRRTSATIAIGAALRQHTLQQWHPKPDPPTWRMASTSNRRCMRCAHWWGFRLEVYRGISGGKGRGAGGRAERSGAERMLRCAA